MLPYDTGRIKRKTDRRALGFTDTDNRCRTEAMASFWEKAMATSEIPRREAVPAGAVNPGIEALLARVLDRGDAAHRPRKVEDFRALVRRGQPAANSRPNIDGTPFDENCWPPRAACAPRG